MKNTVFYNNILRYIQYYIITTMLSLQNICFSYSCNKMLLNGCSVSTEQGNVYVLMGPNGAGKTTLFNIISGFLKPSSGKITLNDEHLSGLATYKINRKGVGRTFQDLRLISKLSVLDNIRLAIKNNPTDTLYGSLFAGNSSNDLPEVLANEYFLGDVLHNMAGEISYGQQKLLTIACCAANDAQVLLLDEPVAGINPVYRKHIATLIHKLKTAGKTIILIEHNTEFIEQVADKILFLANGHISEYNSLNEMRKDATVLEAYL